MSQYKYIIVGGGLAGGSAIEGIRELDKKGSILLIGKEKERPYHRPPLSKKLILGQKMLDEIYTKDESYYTENQVALMLDTEVTKIDSSTRTISDKSGGSYSYEKLLLATGGFPRKLNIPGSDHQDVIYFRYKEDYVKLSKFIKNGKKILIIGGGFIGAELASALTQKGVAVTLIFPGMFLLERIFPKDLAKDIQDSYIKKGVKILFKDAITYLDKKNAEFITTTTSGKDLKFDAVVIGIGIDPQTDLAKNAGLKISNGIEVNEYLQTSNPDIYSAGDVTNFPYKALELSKRVEHWDNSFAQGNHAGKNMAGFAKPYEHMPIFFSDLFDFGFEAVGEVNSSMEILSDLRGEKKSGPVYYSKNGIIRGIMLCNLWDKMDVAKKLILDKKPAGKHIQF